MFECVSNIKGLLWIQQFTGNYPVRKCLFAMSSSLTLRNEIVRFEVSDKLEEYCTSNDLFAFWCPITSSAAKICFVVSNIRGQDTGKKYSFAMWASIMWTTGKLCFKMSGMLDHNLKWNQVYFRWLWIQECVACRDILGFTCAFRVLKETCESSLTRMDDFWSSSSVNVWWL